MEFVTYFYELNKGAYNKTRYKVFRGKKPFGKYFGKTPNPQDAKIICTCWSQSKAKRIALKEAQDFGAIFIDPETNDKHSIREIFETYNEIDAINFNLDKIQDKTTKKHILKTVRKGQKAFRANIIEAYNGKCAITQCDTLEVLEAAHIVPYLGDDTNHKQNGFLLRVDIHKLFDNFLLTIDPNEYKVLISEKLKSSQYNQFNMIQISLPNDALDIPSKQALRMHYKKFMLIGTP